MPHFGGAKAVAGTREKYTARLWIVNPGFNHQKAVLGCTCAGLDRREWNYSIPLGPRRALPEWVLVGLLTCELGQPAFSSVQSHTGWADNGKGWAAFRHSITAAGPFRICTEFPVRRTRQTAVPATSTT
jgi:hypothetical protein